MKIIALAADESGCGYYRVREPARILSKVGHTTHVQSYLDGEYVGGRLAAVRAECDVVVLQRPMKAALAETVPVLQKQGIKVVVELDDDLELIPPSHYGYRHYDPVLRPDENTRHLRRACDAADQVVVSTPELLKYARWTPGVVAPNYVPAKMLDLPHIGTHLIGWAGSMYSHRGDLEVVGHGFSGRTLHVIGDKQSVADELRIPDEDITETGWVPLAEYHERLCDISIGIAPLQINTFNHAKCLDASTLVATGRGVIPAGDVVAGDLVIRRSLWVSVLATTAEAKRSGLELITERGYSIKVSPEHRLLVDGEWRHAGDIQLGNALHLEPEQFAALQPISAPWPVLIRNSSEQIFSHELGPRITLDEQWGELIGLIVGDGCISRGSVSIACDGQDQDLISMIDTRFRSIGLEPRVDCKKFGGRETRSWGVAVSSTQFVHFLRSLGLVTESTTNKHGVKKALVVPEFVWRSPKKVAAAFLRGLFEADGSGRGSVSLCTMNESLARDVQRLLMMFGMTSRLRPMNGSGKYRDRTYWGVTVPSRHMDAFITEIGMISKRKHNKLIEAQNRRHERGRHGTGKTVSWTDPVVGIRPAEITPVDLQVDGESFVAAGIVSHNSWLKPMEYAAAGVPSVVSPVAEYLALQKMLGDDVIRIAKKPRQWASHLRALEDERPTPHEVRKRVEAAGLVIEDNIDLWEKAWLLSRP